MLTGAKPRDPVMDETMQAKAASPGHCTMHQACKFRSDIHTIDFFRKNNAIYRIK